MKAMADHSCNPHLAAVQGIIAEAEEPEQATSAICRVGLFTDSNWDHGEMPFGKKKGSHC